MHLSYETSWWRWRRNEGENGYHTTGASGTIQIKKFSTRNIRDQRSLQRVVHPDPAEARADTARRAAWACSCCGGARAIPGN